MGWPARATVRGSGFKYPWTILPTRGRTAAPCAIRAPPVCSFGWDIRADIPALERRTLRGFLRFDQIVSGSRVFVTWKHAGNAGRDVRTNVFLHHADVPRRSFERLYSSPDACLMHLH